MKERVYYLYNNTYNQGCCRVCRRVCRPCKVSIQTDSSGNVVSITVNGYKKNMYGTLPVQYDIVIGNGRQLRANEYLVINNKDEEFTNPFLIVGKSGYISDAQNFRGIKCLLSRPTSGRIGVGTLIRNNKVIKKNIRYVNKTQ